MGNRGLSVLGIAVAVVGGVFSLQGVGALGGSFMTGSGIWAIIGIAMVITGIALYGRATRRR